MFQVIHIFRKDCRHLWPEILLSFTIAAAFVWLYPYQWIVADDPAFVPINRFLDLSHLQTLANVSAGLLPLVWFFLTARVVHSENLIGDRQYWLTRPYEWEKLLLAKVAFLLAFLYLPFAAAQLALLARAGFHPAQYLAGLFFNLLLMTAVFFLPFFALSTVVSTIVRMLLVLLTLGILTAGIAFLADSSGPDTPSLQIPYSDRLSVPIAILFCASALAVQYSSRRHWLSRALLIAGIPTVAIVAANPLESFLFQQTYQDPTPPRVLSYGIQFPTDLEKRIHTAFPDKGFVTLTIPIQILSAKRGQAISVDNSTVTFIASDGTRVTTPWRPVYNMRAIAGAPNILLQAKLEQADFDRLRTKPVSLQFDLALTELKADPAHALTLPSNGEFILPGIGICHFTPAFGFRSAAVNCKVAWHQPYLTHISAPVANQPCNDQPFAVPSQARFSDWLGELNPDPADFGFTPVWNATINFTGTSTSAFLNADGTRSTQSYICPGVPILIARYREVSRLRYRLTSDPLLLPAAAANRFSLVE